MTSFDSRNILNINLKLSFLKFFDEIIIVNFRWIRNFGLVVPKLYFGVAMMSNIKSQMSDNKSSSSFKSSKCVHLPNGDWKLNWKVVRLWPAITSFNWSDCLHMQTEFSPSMLLLATVMQFEWRSLKSPSYFLKLLQPNSLDSVGILNKSCHMLVLVLVEYLSESVGNSIYLSFSLLSPALLYSSQSPP